MIVAETRDPLSVAVVSSRLHWGRDLIVAETKAYYVSGFTHPVQLQWGRDLIVAETARLSRHALRHWPFNGAAT